MNFTHQPYIPGETIAAIATPPGEGGVAIIRISGKEALAVAAKIFSGKVFHYQTHTAHYGQILNDKKEIVDHALLLVMLGQRSYTGEDTVEIHCHGGSLITRRVLETTLKAGARAAMPGEFTFKAFINGKIDLAQAEAVQELICAKNERAVDAASQQLEGALSQRIENYQLRLTELTAILEAWVDFPEEGLEFASMEEIVEQLKQISDEMQALSETFHDGKILHEGLSICLAGCPNVGKSSLMNALLNKERAIVSEIAGTTRDVLDDFMRLNGLHFKLSDTAGIRQTEERIEKEGIRRSRQTMQQADVTLLLLDASRALTAEDELLLKEVPKDKTIVVWNKIDLPHAASCQLDFPFVTHVSARDRQGFEHLLKMIDQVVWKKGAPCKEEVVVTNVRHKESLLCATEAVKRVIDGLHTSVSPEFLTIEMRLSLSELGKIIGKNISEDILSAIFSKFCIGK